jgi:hypothetical protein
MAAAATRNSHLLHRESPASSPPPPARPGPARRRQATAHWRQPAPAAASTPRPARTRRAAATATPSPTCRGRQVTTGSLPRQTASSSPLHRHRRHRRRYCATTSLQEVTSSARRRPFVAMTEAMPAASRKTLPTATCPAGTPASTPGRLRCSAPGKRRSWGTVSAATHRSKSQPSWPERAVHRVPVEGAVRTCTSAYSSASTAPILIRWTSSPSPPARAACWTGAVQCLSCASAAAARPRARTCSSPCRRRVCCAKPGPCLHMLGPPLLPHRRASCSVTCRACHRTKFDARPRSARPAPGQPIFLSVIAPAV